MFVFSRNSKQCVRVNGDTYARVKQETKNNTQTRDHAILFEIYRNSKQCARERMGDTQSKTRNKNNTKQGNLRLCLRSCCPYRHRPRSPQPPPPRDDARTFPCPRASSPPSPPPKPCPPASPSQRRPVQCNGQKKKHARSERSKKHHVMPSTGSLGAAWILWWVSCAMGGYAWAHRPPPGERRECLDWLTYRGKRVNLLPSSFNPSTT